MLKRFAYVVSEHRGRFALVLLFSVVLNALFTIIDPLVTKTLVDEGLVKQNFRMFAIFALVVVLFGVFVRIGFWVFELLAQKLKNRISESLSLRMLRSFYKVNFAKVKEADSGYFLSRVYDEPAKISQGTVATWIGVVIQLVTLVAAAGVAIYLAWKITLLLCLIVPVLYFLASRFGPKITSVSKVENEEEARLRETMASAIGAYTTVRIFALQEAVQARIRARMGGFLGVLFSRVRTAKSYQTASSICLSLAEAAVLLSAGYGVVTGTLTIGGLFGFLSAFWKLIGAANGLIAQLPELAKLDGYLARLTEFEEMGEEDEGDAGDSLNIELVGVSAGYNGHEVLKDFNLRIGDQERVLIVGPNGSGKTTLAYVMTRFLKPTSGVVKAPRLERVSALLAPFHFVPGSLKDNVDYDNLGEESRQLFWKLVDEFGLRDRVDQDTNLALSEGQKKKAQIIMTLLKDADVYIFDEPLANVDAESKEKVLARQLDRAAGRTLISIMHGDEQFHSRFERIVPLQ
jgi:ATP-binding cassette subfamily B protein